MDEKKLFVIGIILALVIGGAVWLFGQTGSFGGSTHLGPLGSQVEYQDPVYSQQVENLSEFVVEQYFTIDKTNEYSFLGEKPTETNEK